MRDDRRVSAMSICKVALLGGMRTKQVAAELPVQR